MRHDNIVINWNNIIILGTPRIKRRLIDSVIWEQYTHERRLELIFYLLPGPEWNHEV